MGWDAIAMTPHDDNFNIKDLKIRGTFMCAVSLVRDGSGGSYDGGLPSGSLDCSTSEKMIQRALEHTNLDTRASSWSSDEVYRAFKEANWIFDYDPEDKWAYLSAKEFLRICAYYKLPIKFVW